MRIAVGSDHAGFEDPPPHYKPAVIEYLEGKGHTIVDCGTDSGESVDSPDFAANVANAVRSGEADFGILICGTGIGVSIAANRRPGVRAACCATKEMVELAREHNNANVLCVGRRILELDEILEFIDTFLATPFSGGERHARRVAKMA